MIGDAPVAAGGRDPPLAHQLGQQLRVVHHVVAAAEVGILVGEGVEAVRARGDDLARAGLVQRLDVLLGEGLEHVLVAHPPGGVAGAGLARAEDREVDPGRLHELRGRLGRRPGALVERRRAADPVEHLRRRIARLEHAHAEALRPRRAVRLGLAPRVGRALDVAQHRLGLGREAGLDHDQVAAQVDDVVDVLDRHRALLHAGAAGDAVPHDVVADGVPERAAASRPARRPRGRRRPQGPSANRWSRSPMMRSFGESALPVAQAGQASWQRPHSVHE